MSNNECALSVDGVGFFYQRKWLFGTGKNWILRNVTFDIYKGETLGIVGSNGVGKSSLLRVLAGIIEPDEGTVNNYGNIVSLLSIQLGFLPHLTASENVILSAMFMGVGEKKVKIKMADVFEFAGLSGYEEAPVSTFSSGMKARLGFSISTIVDPDVLLIDETLSVGDKDFRKKSFEYIKSRVRSNKTVVVVSHNSNTLIDLSDRVLWVKSDGEVKSGDPQIIIDEYYSS